jgi:hypothetical protein
MIAAKTILFTSASSLLFFGTKKGKKEAFSFLSP